MKRADQRGERHEDGAGALPLCRGCRGLWQMFANQPGAAAVKWSCETCGKSYEASKEADPPEPLRDMVVPIMAVVVPFLALAFVAWVVFART
jgi:uncharacterized protein (DUF983 family)